MRRLRALGAAVGAAPSKAHGGALLAASAALVATLALVAVSGESPISSLAAFAVRPFSSPWFFGNLLDRAGLVLLAALGSAIALRSGNLNLGGEAQIYAPALVSAAILSAPGAAGLGILAFVAALLAALAIGASLALVPAVLKTRLGASEILTSFLLSAAVLPVLDYLVAGPLRDPSGNLLATREIAPAFRLPSLLPPSRLNPSFVVACALAVAIAWFISRTRAGYRLRVSGTAPEFARFSGIRVGSVTAGAMAASGALHGLAGFCAIAGTWFVCHEGFSAGMGWTALAVALIAGRSPLVAIPAALLVAWLQSAADATALYSRMPVDVTAFIQAAIFLVISARSLPGLIARPRPRGSRYD